MPRDRQVSILFVITRMAVGGAPRHVLTKLAGLDRSRFRVALAAGVPEPWEGTLQPEVKRLDVAVHEVPTLSREIRPLNDLKALVHLYLLIRRGRYRIVHTHLSKAGILGRLAARLAGARTIIHTYHGDVFDGYFGRLKSLVLLSVERAVGLWTSRFISVSRPLARRLKARRIGCPGHYVTVQNGVDARAFRPAVPRAGSGALTVGTVAMFYPIKRVDVFVDAARRLLADGLPLRFEIAGGGPDEGPLRRAAAPAGDAVTFLGLRDDVPALLATWDIFVLCSDYEGAGISLIEAMLTGLPVVATRVGGVSDIVVDGETGILVSPGDAGAVAAAAARLVRDGEMRRRMGAAGLRRARSRFAAGPMVRQLEAVYDEATGREGT